MRGNDPDDWPPRNLSSGAFKGILERVANQFTPNHNSQYHSGFIPANSPHLVQQVTPQEINHGQTMDALGVEPLYPTRSFSNSQQPFLSAHSSISRTSSDLGVRLQNFSNDSYTGNDSLIQGTVENINSSLYYPKNYSSVYQNSYPKNPISQNYIQNPSENIATSNQQLNSSYMISPTTMQPTSSYSQNIMPPIGTWKDTPYFDSTSLYEENKNKFDTGFVEGMNQDIVANLGTPAVLINPNPGVPIDINVEENVQKSNLKPSYSDVLSKPPTMTGNKFSSEHKPITKSSTGIGSGYSNKSRKDGNLKSSFSHNKQRSRNTKNSANSNNSSSNFPKLTKIGLDNFENVEFQPLEQSKPINKKVIDSDCTSKLVKKDLQNGQSPIQLRKNKDKKALHDADNLPTIKKDQLNNQVSSSQRKQTPKRTSFINNVRSSKSPVIPLKKNNSEPIISKPFKRSEDTTLYDKSDGDEFVYNQKNSNDEHSSHVGDAIYTKDGGTSGRTRKGKNTRISEPRKNFPKRKTVRSPSNIEQLEVGWDLMKVWLFYAGGVAFWLYGILIDVVQISYGLSIRFGQEWMQKAMVKGLSLRTILESYWKSIKTYFIQKIWNRTGFRDKKRTGGLDSNIPLPTTGEAAMKRLLACRGKDPYNILGLSRLCSDEDIKKYYKRQAFLVHPDKNKQPGAEESFKILAHAFELIGQPEIRAKYDNRLNAEAQLESECNEMSSLLTRLKEKLEESANTIRCTNCNKRHKRVKQDRPVYGARFCGDCRICHGAREGDIWAESHWCGLRWNYYACMDGAIYDITEWASCQKDNLKQLQANTHSVQYRIVSGKKTTSNKASNTDVHTEPELEDFFNNYCRDRFSQSGQQSQSENRKRRGRRKR